MPETPVTDAYAPREITARVADAGVAKARLPLVPLFALGVLAGGFIGLGANFYSLVASDSTMSLAPGRLLGGLAFSLGLILVIVASAELFTGNNLLVMAWVERQVSTGALLRNWTIVYAANFAGAAGLALMVYLTGQWQMADGALGETAVEIAAYKTSLPFGELFFRGVLCNTLVCLAVWLCFAGRSVIDRVAAIIFPITAFVALGYEHSVANMYFFSIGLLLKGEVGVDAGSLDAGGVAANLVPVTLGNIVGGSVMVALAYFVIYRWRQAD